jgi:hypothetical protein
MIAGFFYFYQNTILCTELQQKRRKFGAYLNGKMLRTELLIIN